MSIRNLQAALAAAEDGVLEGVFRLVQGLQRESKQLREDVQHQLASLEEKMAERFGQESADVRARLAALEERASAQHAATGACGVGGQEEAQEEQRRTNQSNKKEGKDELEQPNIHRVHPMFERPPDDLPEDYDAAMDILERDTPLENFRELSERLTAKYGLPSDIKQLLHADWSSRLANSVVINFQPYVDELDELYAMCRQCKEPFDVKIQQIADSLGGEALLPPLKGKERAESKAQFKYRDQTGKPAYYRLTDILRATLVFKTLEQVYKAVEYVDGDAELEVIELTDRNFKPLNAYRDVQMSLRLRRDGLPAVVCELQINTELMAMVKEFRGHRTFEVQRELVAAVKEGCRERCEKILRWGRESLGSTAQDSLLALLNDPFSRFLHHAARIGCAEVIRCLITHKADANCLDRAQRTPLHEAMAGGHERAVWALLSYGRADVTLRDGKGESAFLEGLIMLRKLPDEETAQRTVSLVAQHASPAHRGRERDQLRVVLQGRYVPSTDLVNASSDGNLKKAKELLCHDMADPNTKLVDGRRPLAEAIDHGHLQIVRLLLSVDADPNVVMKDGRPGLAVAAQYQKADILFQMLHANADPNVADSDGRPLLAGALHREQPELVRHLLDANADPNVADGDGQLLLAGALRQRRPAELALELLRAGARAGPALQELSEPQLRPFGPGNLTGKWNYGSIALDATGTTLWCAPFCAENVLRLDVNTWAQSFVEIEGLPPGKNHFQGGLALGNDGLMYASPRDAPGVLVVNPHAGTARLWQHEDLQGNNKYCGVALAGNGVLYCAPRNAKAVLCIDPGAGELRFLWHLRLQADAKYSGIAEGGDGRLYCAPLDAKAVLVIDPKTETLSFIEGGDLLQGSFNYFGICAAGDGRLACAPFNGGNVLVIDPWSGALTQLPLPASVQGDYKCCGICLGADGRLYCPPHNTGALAIDLDAGTVQLLSAPGKNMAFMDIAAYDGGKRLVCCPCNAARHGVVDLPLSLDDLRRDSETAHLALHLSKHLQEEGPA